MARIRKLSDESYDILREIIAERNQRRSPPLRSQSEGEDQFFSPETYIAKTPPQGIEGLFTETGTGSPSGLNSEFCDVYRVDAQGILVPYEREVEVYNPNDSDIPGDAYTVITRHKDRVWLAATAARSSTWMRFQLLEDLYSCSSAEAVAIEYQDGSWCTSGTGNEDYINVYDSIGLPPTSLSRQGEARLGVGTATDMCEEDIPDGLLAVAGEMGIALLGEDSGLWEIVAIGDGCCTVVEDTCSEVIDGIPTKEILGFDSSKIQYLSHDSCGCLIWRDTVECEDEQTGTGS